MYEKRSAEYPLAFADKIHVVVLYDKGQPVLTIRYLDTLRVFFFWPWPLERYPCLYVPLTLENGPRTFAFSFQGGFWGFRFFWPFMGRSGASYGLRGAGRRLNVEVVWGFLM